MGESAMSKQIAGQRQKEGGDKVYIGQTIGDCANYKRFFAEFFPGNHMPYTCPGNYVCQ